MAEMSNRVLEGVFAVNKPPNLSSAQVLRDLQNKFAESTSFAPLLQHTKRKEEEQARHQPKRRRRRGDDHAFKMGHGGTLDPLATGVLIVGIGRGTKYLNNFLTCTKTYETVVLFGKSTDTYDIAGKIVAEGSTSHMDQNLVEEKLAKFRGKFKQVPPLYSALRIQGMKAYEYARTGKPLPRELESREMNVEECTMLEWYNEGQHNFRWPAEEASEADKAVAMKLMHKTDVDGDAIETEYANGRSIPSISHPELDKQDEARSPTDRSAHTVHVDKAAMHTHQLPPLSSSPASAPAARIRLTVSSGFYVRSFAHDLGVACNSYGIMSELERSRQAEFTVSEPVPTGLVPALTYDDFDKGEEIWGPKICDILERWMAINTDTEPDRSLDDRDRPGKHFSAKRNGRMPDKNSTGKKRKRFEGPENTSDAEPRRNTSSPE